jgi:hypothetical protein
MELKPFTRDHFSILPLWFANAAELAQWGGTKLRFPLDDQQMLTMLENVLENPPLLRLELNVYSFNAPAIYTCRGWDSFRKASGNHRRPSAVKGGIP